jgi:integrase/recombinase XerD
MPVRSASKGRKGGRIIPLSKDLKAAPIDVKSHSETLSRLSLFVIATERVAQTSSYTIVNKVATWYAALGFQGASSHSARRTANANWARRILNVGGGLRVVQLLAGHSALGTTQRYINAEAMKRVVELQQG